MVVAEQKQIANLLSLQSVLQLRILLHSYQQSLSYVELAPLKESTLIIEIGTNKIKIGDEKQKGKYLENEGKKGLTMQ